MLAKVISLVSVYELPRNIGEVLEVDEITFRNLVKDGRLAPADIEQTEIQTEKPKLTTRKK